METGGRGESLGLGLPFSFVGMAGDSSGTLAGCKAHTLRFVGKKTRILPQIFVIAYMQAMHVPSMLAGWLAIFLVPPRVEIDDRRVDFPWSWLRPAIPVTYTHNTTIQNSLERQK